MHITRETCFEQKQWCSPSDKPHQRKRKAHETTILTSLTLTVGISQKERQRKHRLVVQQIKLPQRKSNL